MTNLTLWAQDLRSACQSLVGAVNQAFAAAVDLGPKLAAAKRSLPYEEFRRLFKNQADCIRDPLPITLQWARSLIRISENESMNRWIDSLPKSVAALSILSVLEEEQIAESVTQGTITVETTKHEAAALVRSIRGRRRDPNVISDEVFIRRAVETLQQILRRAKPGLLAELKAKLLQELS